MTARVLTTALPYSLDADAPFHLSVFVTHRLSPDRAGGTLSEFPAVADWVGTLAAARLRLHTSHGGEPIGLRVVSAPDAAAWAAVFGPDTPVSAYPAPKVTEVPWNSYPASTVGEHALGVHLASAMAHPLSPPPARGNPALDPVLDVLASLSPATRTLLNTYAEARAGRDKALLDRKQAEALSTLGVSGRLVNDGRGYPSEPLPWRSAIEILLDDELGDQRVTNRLDALVDAGPVDEPVLALMRDVHAARRYYQREEEQPTYAPSPVDGATTPRPEVPVPDFHQLAGSFAAVPALMRRLGLVLDVVLEDPARLTDVAGATWVTVSLVPGSDARLVLQASPRTRCVAEGGTFHALSSDTWSGGALPLGDPDRYVVLDLDPDASALKLEQHVRDLPRELALELNGDRASSAPGSLRSSGFAIAQTDRVSTARDRLGGAEAVDLPDDGPGVVPPTLGYDELVRGVRLEVWDDVTSTWRSVHERRVDVTAGGEKVLTDAPDVGYLPLTSMSRTPGDATHPYYLHEVFTGWDGWSLSAPRPGRVVVHGDGVHHEAGTEKVYDEPPDAPASHVHTRTRVEPGSLPRLRYGWSYSFRVRGVDLAGNTVLRRTRPPGRPGPDQIEAAAQQLERLRQAYGARPGILGHVRPGVLAALPRAEGRGPLRRLVETVGEEVERTAEELERIHAEAFVSTTRARLRLPPLARTGVSQVDALLVQRLGEQVADAPAGGPADLRARVSSAVGHLARTSDTWRVRPQLELDPERFGGIDDTLHPQLPAPPPVVTAPRPFLRWSPVPAPVLVARRALSSGESLQRLVVRAGERSERHVLPPKTSQLEAEQHGMFDAAIGSADPDVQRLAFGWALKERGTLTDERIPDADHPGGTVAQPGIALLARPGANPDTLVTLEQIAQDRDTPLGEGQYVVHDTDQLVLPYLPDPLAAGLALVFYDAGAPHTLPDPRVLQAVVVPYRGTWPAVEPLRLVLEPAETLGARVLGNEVRVGVPAGEQVRVAMSSSLREEDLRTLGLWRTHVVSDRRAQDAQAVAAREVLTRAAVAGWTWWLTPSEDLRLVHATPRPVRAPQLLALRVGLRPPGLSVVALAGVVDVHGPSTERLTLEASWSEWVDDLTADGPVRVDRHDVVGQSPVGADERYGLLWLTDAVVPAGGDDETTVSSHRAIHTFPDTHHRRVTYAARGSTRYQEFFTAEELPGPDDPACVGPGRELTVPSSARPAAPEVTGTVPLLLWEESTEPDQPFALRRTRRSGVRIWMRRPWYSSGDGELLGVVVSTSGEEPSSVISLWGRDPILHTGAIDQGTRPPLVSPADLVLAAVGGAVLPRPARPVTAAARLALADVRGTPTVLVHGYRAEYHPDRKEWFTDVALDPGMTLWPFVRLAVARYQPDSIDGCALSPVVLTDWAQPLPERTGTLSRPDAGHARMTVTGTIAASRALGRRGEAPPPAAGFEGLVGVSPLDSALLPSRAVFATVQTAPGEGASDLEWTDGPRVRLPLVDGYELRGTWSAELALPEPIEPVTPGGSAACRVLVEEYEFLDADPLEGPATGSPSTAARLVYADHFPL